MTNKLKATLFLLLFGLACYVLGMYTISYMTDFRQLQPHQWILTSLFGLMFLGLGIGKLTEDEN